MAQLSTVEVCAVIVSYEPETRALHRLIASLQPQVGATVIVDNGSSSAVIDGLCQQALIPSTTLISLDENLGIATGVNRGVRWAKCNGYAYCALFDQDSEPSDDMVAQLLAGFELAQKITRVSAVGPRYIDRNNGMVSPFIQLGGLKFRSVTCSQSNALVPADFLISSGSLFSVKAFDEIGAMDETLFIDHVDTEWFLRARSKGFAAFGVCQAQMTHRLGENSISVRLWRLLRFPVHTPMRHYYMYRNSILLMRRSYVPVAWRFNDSYRLITAFVLFLIFAPERLRRLKMICNGLWDGLLGRSGRYR